MEAESPREFLEKMLPARFKPDRALGIDVVAQLNLTGANGGNWVVTIKDQKLKVTEGTSTCPTLTLKMEEKDFLNIVNRKTSTEKVFFSGKISFKGNLSLALKLKDAGFL